MYKIELFFKLIILLFLLMIIQSRPADTRIFGYSTLVVTAIIIIGEAIYTVKKSKKKE